MSRARRVLLFAALLLLAAEGVSLSLLFRSLADRQSDRVRLMKAQASSMLPKIVDWMRHRGDAIATVDPWIEPFDELTADPRHLADLDTESRGRLQAGDLSVQFQPQDRALSILGQVETDRGAEVFKLTSRLGETTGIATDGVLAGQHLLIFVASLLAFVLAALAREPEGSGTAMGAYEEAMVRLRQRDHERVAAFETERAALTSTLRDREAMARAGELTAGIVHEVGNSIGAIAIQSRVAEKSADEKVSAAGASIAAEVRAIQTVMNRFVNFIRTEEVRMERFDLGRMVRRVSEREGQHHPTNITVSGDPVTVVGDEDLLERAIENVVRNACQAAGPAGHVSIAHGLKAGEAFVHVSDDGPGIADPDRALKPFESNRPGGLGLGLPLVLKILSLHQGTLDLASPSSGHGTQAFCRWPQTVSPATIGNVSEPSGLESRSL